MERKFQDNIDLALLVQCLSHKRLRPYLKEADNDLLEALNLYEHNVLWSARLWVIMHFFEITLRNRVDKALSGYYGPDWILPERALLRSREIERVIDAQETLAKQKKIVTRDGIIAELSLGFWVFLFSRKYDDRERAFWRRALYRLFPGKSRKNMHKDLEKIRKLRNRLAHHERIYNPEDARKCILSVLEKLSPEMVSWAHHLEKYTQHGTD